MTQRAIVIGAGVSGIAAAVRLLEKGIEPTVLEAADSIGGRIGRQPWGGADVDLGGRNFQRGDENLIGLFRHFGVDRFVEYEFDSIHVGTERAYDLRRSGSRLTRLRRFAANLRSAPLAEIGRLQRAATDARRTKDGSVVASAYWKEIAEATGDPTITAHFGRALSDGLLRPVTLRMMAAEPDEVYLGNIGPLLGRKAGAQNRLEGGMGRFLDAAKNKLAIETGCKVVHVVTRGNRVVGVRAATGSASPSIREAELVVIATDAHTASALVPFSPRLGEQLRRVIYRPVSTVVAEYTRVQFPQRVGGLFLPRSSPLSHAAKYDDQGRVRFSFAGVASRGAIAASSNEALLEIAENEFRRFGGELVGRGRSVSATWDPGLCGHSWMHHRTLEEIRRETASTIGLALTGDYFRGNLLDACARAARENVDQLIRQSLHHGSHEAADSRDEAPESSA